MLRPPGQKDVELDFALPHHHRVFHNRRGTVTCHRMVTPKRPIGKQLGRWLWGRLPLPITRTKILLHIPYPSLHPDPLLAAFISMSGLRKI